MERLTYWQDGTAMMKKRGRWESDGIFILAAYEDTGLSPEEIKGHDAAYIEIMTRTYGPLHQKISQWLQAEQDGRLVVLPCRQGDELWTYCNHPVKRVYSFTVSDVSTLNGRTVLNTLGLGTIRPEDISKTVFRTREEAERAMKEMGGQEGWLKTVCALPSEESSERR